MEFKEIKPKNFYGKSSKKCIVPADPQESDLSDASSSDNDFEVPKLKSVILAEETDSENESLQNRNRNRSKIIIEETSDEEENILEEQPENIRKKRKIERLICDWSEYDIPFQKRTGIFREPEFHEISSPLEYFCKFFSLDLMALIVEQTNLYSAEKQGSPIDLTNSELTNFISILLIMGVINLPALEDYWANTTRIPQVADIMPVRRFKKIRRCLHFNDNSMYNKETKDRFFKVRPLIEAIRSRCQNVVEETQYSVDETMVPYKGTFAGNLRQYIKSKPHKWGYKLFVLAGVSGIIYDFIPYQGANTFHEFTNLTENEKEFGVGAKVVIALCKSIHNSQEAVVFFDNYFSGLDLLIYLKEKLGILSLGTFRSNRIGGCPLDADKILSKRDRGSYVYRSDQNKGVIMVKWLDNKCVLIGSTYCGIEPVTTLKRYSTKEKKKVDVNCPVLISQYNKHMGGVDKANSLLGLYRTPSRARRWYYPIFTYLLDMCVVNAWLTYKQDSSALNEKNMTLKNFRMELASSLQKTMKCQKKYTPTKNKKIAIIENPTKSRPDDATRRDNIGHWPSYIDKGRCRHCTQGFSRTACVKCNMRLCFTAKKNCFYDFHNG